MSESMNSGAVTSDRLRDVSGDDPAKMRRRTGADNEHTDAPRGGFTEQPGNPFRRAVS